MKRAIVVKAFTEQRTGKSYNPGDVYAQMSAHENAWADEGKVAAYEMRGLIRIEEAMERRPSKNVSDTKPLIAAGGSDG
jgi:hypothetical protein